MRIVSNSYHRLEVEVRQTWLPAAFGVATSILLFALYKNWSELATEEIVGLGASAVVFGAVTLYFLRPARFIFDRASDQFRWIRPGVDRAYRGSESLGNIRRIRVDKSETEEGYPSYQVLVETQADKIPLFHTYVSEDKRNDCHQMVETMRRWLAG